MYVAGEIFGWDHKFPVLIIDYLTFPRKKSVDFSHQMNCDKLLLYI